MTNSHNPIRDILGEMAPPPSMSPAEYRQGFCRFIGDDGPTAPLEIYLLHEIFYQMQCIRLAHARQRDVFHCELSLSLRRQFNPEFIHPPKELDGAFTAVKRGRTPQSDADLNSFLQTHEIDWRELEQAAFTSRAYIALSQEIDSGYRTLGYLQKMLTAARLSPALRRRIEAQAQLLEQEVARASHTIDHQNDRTKPHDQPTPAQLQSA